MIINKIQKLCIHLLLINCLVNFSRFTPKKFLFLGNFDSDFLYVEVWFTVQNSRPLELEDKMNINFVIN